MLETSWIWKLILLTVNLRNLNTDNVFSDDTLFLTEIAVLKVKIYI